MADTVRLRFRVTTEIAGTTHQANSTETLPATEEVWKAVDLGRADMDPAPGVSNQPYPPWAKDVNKSVLPPAPAPRAAPAKAEDRPKK